MRRYRCERCGAVSEGQRAYVLHLLEEAGAAGVHTFALRSMFIANPSQRIAELEARGHVIEHRDERYRGEAVGTRYKLVCAPVAACEPVAGPDVEGQLSMLTEAA